MQIGSKTFSTRSEEVGFDPPPCSRVLLNGISWSKNVNNATNLSEETIRNDMVALHNSPNDILYDMINVLLVLEIRSSQIPVSTYFYFLISSPPSYKLSKMQNDCDTCSLCLKNQDVGTNWSITWLSIFSFGM